MSGWFFSPSKKSAWQFTDIVCPRCGSDLILGGPIKSEVVVHPRITISGTFRCAGCGAANAFPAGGIQAHHMPNLVAAGHIKVMVTQPLTPTPTPSSAGMAETDRAQEIASIIADYYAENTVWGKAEDQPKHQAEGQALADQEGQFVVPQTVKNPSIESYLTPSVIDGYGLPVESGNQLTWTGKWQPGFTYPAGSLVVHKGKIYHALDKVPASGLFRPEHWATIPLDESPLGKKVTQIAGQQIPQITKQEYDNQKPYAPQPFPVNPVPPSWIGAKTPPKGCAIQPHTWTPLSFRTALNEPLKDFVKLGTGTHQLTLEIGASGYKGQMAMRLVDYDTGDILSTGALAANGLVTPNTMNNTIIVTLTPPSGKIGVQVYGDSPAVVIATLTAVPLTFAQGPKSDAQLAVSLVGGKGQVIGSFPTPVIWEEVGMTPRSKIALPAAKTTFHFDLTLDTPIALTVEIADAETGNTMNAIHAPNGAISKALEITGKPGQQIKVRASLSSQTGLSINNKAHLTGLLQLYTGPAPTPASSGGMHETVATAWKEYNDQLKQIEEPKTPTPAQITQNFATALKAAGQVLGLSLLKAAQEFEAVTQGADVAKALATCAQNNWKYRGVWKKGVDYEPNDVVHLSVGTTLWRCLLPHTSGTTLETIVKGGHLPIASNYLWQQVDSITGVALPPAPIETVKPNTPGALPAPDIPLTEELVASEPDGVNTGGWEGPSFALPIEPSSITPPAALAKFMQSLSFTWRGPWSTIEIYSAGDVVRHQGPYWLCNNALVDVGCGEPTPGNPYWTRLLG